VGAGKWVAVIRDPKGLAEACASVADVAGRHDAVFDSAHAAVMIAAILTVSDDFVEDVDSDLPKTARDCLGSCAMFALALMHNTGNDRWDFRKALQKKRWPFVLPETATKPIRRNAGKAYKAWMARDRKDFHIALELLCVACSDLAMTAYGSDLDELVMAPVHALQGKTTP
jgi:hypothetical protein